MRRLTSLQLAFFVSLALDLPVCSSDTCFVPLHFVFAHVVQPRKYRPRASPASSAEPHSGHRSFTSTFGSSFFGGGAASGP